MPNNSILAIFAHPDDETFGLGGTLARYADAGVPITMVSATRGEVGEIAPGTDATPETLGAHREQELRDAMAILGVTDVRFLGFRDSGMKGTHENKHPDALINAPEDAVTEAMVRIIREVRPRVVVTWDESGGYGHPDHVFVHYRATEAFRAAADASRFPANPGSGSLTGDGRSTANMLWPARSLRLRFAARLRQMRSGNRRSAAP